MVRYGIIKIVVFNQYFLCRNTPYKLSIQQTLVGWASLPAKIQLTNKKSIIKTKIPSPHLAGRENLFNI